MRSKSTILIVDDDLPSIELMKTYLYPEDYEIVTARDGEEALRLLSGNMIDLVLLGVLLPGLNGFEVTRRVRKDTLGVMVPIILITAFQATESRVKGIEAGCDDFITKPVDKTELIARVRSLLKIRAYNKLMNEYRKELELEVASKTAEIIQAHKDLEAASLETIFRLASASEYKDKGTGEHIRRMSLYCAAIARQMGFDKKTVALLLSASPMHDLGKIGIPDAILLKSSNLDLNESVIMKQHAAIGAEILKGSGAESIRMGETIAISHHERWDGSGYPNGLKGEEIPIAGRIAAVADAFDALTYDRPYKKATSIELALTIIRDGKGDRFDPDVVDAFLAIQNEILHIKCQNDMSALEKLALNIILHRQEEPIHK